jgi:hypothetical protein
MGGWRARSSVRSQRNCYRSRPLEAIHDLNKPNLNFKRCPASPQSGLGNLGSLFVWPCRSPFRLRGQSWQYDTPNHSPRCSLSRPEISLHLISACVIPAKDSRCIGNAAALSSTSFPRHQRSYVCLLFHRDRVPGAQAHPAASDPRLRLSAYAPT